MLEKLNEEKHFSINKSNYKEGKAVPVTGHQGSHIF
jgi:hypothetical protein